MKTGWIIPFIIVGGALQACGGAMNAQLRNSLVNPFLALAVSLFLIAFFFTGAFFVMPTPLPTLRNIAAMPWWAAPGGLVGAVQVYASLTQIHKVGAGTFMGFTVTAALIMSLVIDHYGWFRLEPHPITGLRAIGAVLLVGGITLVGRS